MLIHLDLELKSLTTFLNSLSRSLTIVITDDPGEKTESFWQDLVTCGEWCLLHQEVQSIVVTTQSGRWPSFQKQEHSSNLLQERFASIWQQLASRTLFDLGELHTPLPHLQFEEASYVVAAVDSQKIPLNNHIIPYYGQQERDVLVQTFLYRQKGSRS